MPPSWFATPFRARAVVIRSGAVASSIGQLSIMMSHPPFSSIPCAALESETNGVGHRDASASGPKSYSGGTSGGKDREGKREKKTDGGGGPSAEWSHDREEGGGTVPWNFLLALPFCRSSWCHYSRRLREFSRPLLNRLASRRGSFAENSR